MSKDAYNIQITFDQRTELVVAHLKDCIEGEKYFGCGEYLEALYKTLQFHLNAAEWDEYCKQEVDAVLKGKKDV